MTYHGEVGAVMRSLEAYASAKTRDEMGPRYGIVAADALGVPMGKMQLVAKSLGRHHELAAALWETGCYEARMVACMIDDPTQVTPEQMDRWRAAFDNWAIVDTVCFKLFDRVPYAFDKIDEWAALTTSSAAAPPSRCSPPWRSMAEAMTPITCNGFR